jgi:hypothetical protein
VRAGLAIRDFALEEDLELRVDITTGQALIRIDARPDAGEGMASGDVVNTAARLQSAAPVNGVLADETTCRATRAWIEYRDAPPVEAKGKAEPISVVEAVAARSRFGVDVAHEARSGLVGRERELAVVHDAFDRARHARTPQLLTLVGVPGIGKSRLVYELSQIVEADPELITWRQGRCLAYGDGITLWALGEIVKAQAGILEQDSEPEIEDKLHRAVADVVAREADVRWIESELRSLVGLTSETELGGDRRGAAFSAWRGFLEAMAEQRPLVLVFEDLHWADESLLDFVDQLVDWIVDVPLLVVGTARPELLERRPGWGGGKLDATTLALTPLSDDDTALLLGQLLNRPVLDAESQQALLDRAGGNPLYAEQFAELYVERGSAEELELPETLQGIIAARLDGLPEDEKELLHDAAVVGKVFWASSLDRDSATALPALHSLERKGFVRRQRRSSVEGESELAFAHALVRDVAYGQIPRADRAARHQRVAEWIESLGRPEDHAEMLAYHWRSALDLVRASGRSDAELELRARLALREAGDRAFALNSFPAAERYYADALELWPEHDGERSDLLFRRANTLYVIGDERQSAALEEALAAALAAGDNEHAAEAEALLAHVAWHRGETDAVKEHLDRATDLVGGAPSAAKARVLALSARIRAVSGEDPQAAMSVAEEAHTMAAALGLEELQAHSLATIGSAKSILGDPSGIADQERALELALEINSPIAATILNNIGVATDDRDGGLLRTEELYRESWRVGTRFGDASMLRFLRGNLIWVDFVRGRWDDARAAADDFVAECESGSPHVLEALARHVRAAIRLGRGDVAGGLSDHERALEQCREVQDPEMLGASLSLFAAAYAALERWADARLLADELVGVAAVTPGGLNSLSAFTPYAHRLGLDVALRSVVEPWPATAWKEVAVLTLDLDFRAAADVYGAMPSPTLEGRMRMHAGEHLVASGRTAEGAIELRRALDFHRSVGATFWIERADALLAAAQSESA